MANKRLKKWREKLNVLCKICSQESEFLKSYTLVILSIPKRQDSGSIATEQAAAGYRARAIRQGKRFISIEHFQKSSSVKDFALCTAIPPVWTDLRPKKMPILNLYYWSTVEVRVILHLLPLATSSSESEVLLYGWMAHLVDRRAQIGRSCALS